MHYLFILQVCLEGDLQTLYSPEADVINKRSKLIQTTLKPDVELIINLTHCKISVDRLIKSSTFGPGLRKS